MYGSLCTRRDARETRDVRGGIDCVVSIEAGEENMEVSSKARRPTCLIGRAMKNKSINTFEAKRFFTIIGYHNIQSIAVCSTTALSLVLRCDICLSKQSLAAHTTRSYITVLHPIQTNAREADAASTS